MQPTLPQGTGAGATDMDLPAVQSMDWLFKKERIYLLAQFWQQVRDKIKSEKFFQKKISKNVLKEDGNEII